MGLRLGFWKRGLGMTVGRSGPRFYAFPKVGCLGVVLCAVLLAMSACRAPAGPRTDTRIETGDDATVDATTENRDTESGVEAGDVQGGVVSTRFGLDEGLVQVLRDVGERVTDVAGRVLFTVGGVIVGLCLVFLFAPALPVNALFQTIGLTVGAALLVLAVIVPWLL